MKRFVSQKHYEALLEYYPVWMATNWPRFNPQQVATGYWITGWTEKEYDVILSVTRS